MSRNALLAQRIVRGGAKPYERRVFADGRVEERTDVVAEYVDGELQFDKKPWEWVTLVTLTAEAMRELRAAMRLAFQPRHIGVHEPSGTAIGGAEVTWTSFEQSPASSVVMRSHPVTEIADVDALGPLLDRLITAEQDRLKGWR